MNKYIFIVCCLILCICFSCKPEPDVAMNHVPVKKDSSDIKKPTGRKIPEDTSRIKIIVGTFLGNEKRNYYGNRAPSKLKKLWKFFLGNGQTRVGSKSYTWAGAGWTGQPLVITEDSVPYLVQGAYDHHLRKINALTGKEIWKYKFDDVIKSTGTIWVNSKADNYDEKYVLMQGSRQGYNTRFDEAVIPSYRAVSLVTGRELWKLNSTRTESYSRDVDGSSVVINDTAYIGLENGIFTVFSPDRKNAVKKNNILQPSILKELMLYEQADKAKHGSDLVTESSPARLGDRVYISSGSGHIYGYNLVSGLIDWDFFTGADMDGTPVVTNDSCLIITIEKQFIEGRGGALKLDPSKPAEKSVVWFFPTETKKYSEWLGGVVGSPGIHDHYNSYGRYPAMAAFIGIDGFLYVVGHTNLKASETVTGFDNKTKYQTPELLFKYHTGPSISTPVFAENRLIACSYTGIHLFEFDEKAKFRVLDIIKTNSIEATPAVYDNRLYIASRDGFLYCYGDDSLAKEKPEYLAGQPIIRSKKQETNTKYQKTRFETTSAMEGKCYLIAGSFSIKRNAENYSDYLTSKGYQSIIITPDNSRNLVTIGKFDSKNAAMAKQAELRQINIETWIFQ